MSLLATVCSELGLTSKDTTSIDNKNILPQTWEDFMSIEQTKLKQCKQTMLKELNIDSITVDQIWFNMNYLALYNHFGIVKWVNY